MGKSITLTQLTGSYAIAKLAARSPIPTWADGDGFVSLSRTDDELSLVCLAERVPNGLTKSTGWTCFKFEGPFDFAETGIALAAIQPLAEAHIGILLVSTFDTDYLLVKSDDAERAKLQLLGAGHRLT